MQVPRIISSPALSIVGLAINTTPSSPEIGQLWKTYFATPNKNFTRAEPGVSYGVMQLDRSRGVLRYLAGESSLDNPSDLEVWQIPASKYAIFQADLNSVSDVFTYIYAQWLPQSGYA